MVIKDILNKVSNADPNDPKVKELREKLAKLKGEEAPTKEAKPAATKEPSKTQPPPPPQETASKGDAEIHELAKASEEERRRFAQEQQPQLRVKEERTHKLVAKQVGQLIELTTELQKRLNKVEQENKNAHQEIERMEKKNEDLREKMDLIDGRLEKFMGLYEIITNQYNPFAEQQGTTSLPDMPVLGSSEKKKQVSVADGLKGDEKAVEYEQGEMSSENKAKINQLLAELEAQEKEQKDLSSEDLEASSAREEELSGSLRDELHEMFLGFEGRMKQYLDDSMQQKLHATVGELESVLNEEIAEAVEERIDQLTSHDDVFESAFAELSSLEESSQDPEGYRAVEESFEEEVRSVDEHVKAIPPSLYFRLQDGRVLRSKQDLVSVLEDMDDSVFVHHVNDSHNDFADWLELALRDSVGEELRGASRVEMVELLRSSSD